MVASVVFDQTGSYDGFMVVMGLILLASGLALFGQIKADEQLPEAVAAANPSPS
jgi:hypothetical protein